MGRHSLCLLVKARLKHVLVAVSGACILLAFGTLAFVRKREEITQRGSSVGTLNYRNVPQAIGKEDRKFLDDFFQKQGEDNRRPTNPEGKPGQNFAKAEDDSNPAPRAELIVNTSEVRRAQLVVNSRIVERAEPIRPRNH